MSLETVGIAIAAFSATASAVSAYASRLAVDRANQAFVWPAISHKREDGQHILLVRLHNDGPGVAYDVRWSVAEPWERKPGEWDSGEIYAAERASSVIRALRPGESIPLKDGDWLEKSITLPDDDVWWPLVRWTDAARVRWELSEQGPFSLRWDPRRLQTWRWQVWRPERDW